MLGDFFPSPMPHHDIIKLIKAQTKPLNPKPNNIQISRLRQNG